MSYGKVYVMGALRNPRVPELANKIRAFGFEVFDDWYSPGPDADEYWQAYEKQRGRTYLEALRGAHAQDIYEFDKSHLDSCDFAVMVMPCGKSAHMEMGYLTGRGKMVFILFDGEPDRYDIMYLFAQDVFMNEDDLLHTLRGMVRPPESLLPVTDEVMT